MALFSWADWDIWGTILFSPVRLCVNLAGGTLANCFVTGDSCFGLSLARFIRVVIFYLGPLMSLLLSLTGGALAICILTGDVIFLFFLSLYKVVVIF